MRSWMARSPFRERASEERKPRKFDANDLLLLAIAQTLEDRFMFRGDGLDAALPALERFLRRPHHHRSSEFIFINTQNWSIDFLPKDTHLESGIILDVSHERHRISRFLGIAPTQEELSFGPLPMERLKS